ncbi:MAG: 4-hydroxy-3-methylbut-2-enyl diphosphate reductase [Lentisphaerae bacterium RIFOXYA12_FULL_48_11]|nr:MAG: 4-hydroxy-3-methylbut-2-enyl diphosphate reductase [Lentisphaerae bacterium RIFOXYA12_FULL_48_11]
MNKQPVGDVAGKVILACPHGFCAGVERAVRIAECMLKGARGPVYCLREIVHNRQVVRDLSSRGIIFVKDINDVPEGAVVLFSAHGVAPEIRKTAGSHKLKIIDATCPFVNKVHSEVCRYASEGYTILLVGHRNHDEIIGVAGEAPDSVVVIEDKTGAENVDVKDPTKVAVMTQTTLSVDETRNIIDLLRKRFPQLKTPAGSDICYATQNRQLAVRSVAEKADIFIVLGAQNSSNSNRLVEVAGVAGCKAFLVSEIEQIHAVPLDQVRVVGLTAGASTPEYFVRDALACLAKLGFVHIEECRVVDENVHFAMPAGMNA